MSNFEISVLFFLQLALILGTCRAVGWIARWFGQPQVVAEMIAGIVMGPSLFGLLWPDAQTWLFPPETRVVLYVFAQVGLALFMFLVGLEFDTDLIRRRLRSAASVSLAGILVPFALGCALGAALIRLTGFFADGVSLWEGAFFLGASMSITAFPVLARIIHERGLAGTSLGTLTLAAGAINDAAAWCVLALVLASFQQNATIAILAIGGGVLYAVGLLTVGKGLLGRLDAMAEREQGVNGRLLTLVLILVLLGSWFTDRIGIYAVFGAFIMGVAMPRGRFARNLQRLLDPLVSNLLVPCFFVYSGLNTSIGLLDSPVLWGIALLVLLAACLGKGVACWAAARLSGELPREAMAIGALMNARGLMELIILNIGLEHALITPTLFTIMVLMAIITTLMASPIFEWVYWRARPPMPIVREAVVRD
ncbi:MAG: cation:proton antiporter [Gammaproteobacteria bacterium]